VLGYQSTATAFVVIFVGLIMGAGLIALTLRRLGALRSIALVIFPLVLIAGAAWGLGSATDDSRECPRYVATAKAQMESGNFQAAHDALSKAHANGKCANDATVASSERDLAAKEGAAKVATDAAKARNDADKERMSAARFAKSEPGIAAGIKDAQGKASQGKWEDCATVLDAAESALDWYKGTSIEQNRDYASLRSQIAAQRAVSNDAALLLVRCGTPSLDDSTENDDPRPPIPSRTIEYKKQGLRFMYIPGGGAKLGDPPPYQWKFVGITDMAASDPANARVVSHAEAVRRMPCFGGK
jgi:hypothetical protein